MDKTLTITKGNVNDLEDVYLSFYNHFPENERKSLNHLRQLMVTGHYNLLLLNKNDNKRIGYAFIYVSETQKTLWLDYIVIETPYQGKGLGSVFFNEIIRFLGKQYIAIFMEVEIPNGKDKEQERRLKYYKRLETSFVDIEYKLPTLDGGFPMYLLYKPIKLDKLTRNCIIQTIKEVYEFIHWDIQNKEDTYNEVISTLK
ncbi:acetyltransferase (GNAT) family protein [Natranaerovirga hydrolytica]|uniref:Acetyltransferase (GNAT) family protein n=1 Tax=Natranaerovirga hydrolytica TaxID=680378 RepID=A0A4R1N218_9FIRM|nr:GNAT family N-acetyltransferase [Natranaerovirga hydrolytica]TCK98044.1 acetyltransferase (GNAT) family protein [Natranaerovirga hydrolytica]